MSLRCCGVPEPTAGASKGSPTSSQPPATFPPQQGDKPASDAPDSSRATTPVRMSEDTSPSPAGDCGTLSMRSGSSSSGMDRAAPNQVAPGSATPSQRRRTRRDNNGRHLALVDRHSDSADHSALLHLLTASGLLGGPPSSARGSDTGRSGSSPDLPQGCNYRRSSAEAFGHLALRGVLSGPSRKPRPRSHAGASNEGQRSTARRVT